MLLTVDFAIGEKIDFISTLRVETEWKHKYTSISCTMYAQYYVYSRSTEAGVLKKLSLAGLAKLRRLRYSRLRFGLASAGYLGLGVHDRPANSQLIPQNSMKYLGLARLA